MTSPAPARRPAPRSPVPPRAGTAINRLLYPTDLSDASDVAFAHASLVAETFDAELTVYHSIDLRKVARIAAGGAMPGALQEAELAAVRHIEALAARTSASTRVRVEYGLAPHQAVVAAIAASRPDLTVMSTHGRKGIAHLLIGSVAESAIEQGGRPILCVRGRDHAPAPATGYRRILVPTDLRSRDAFPMAATLAEVFGAEVVAVHVAPFERASLTGLPQGLLSPLPSDAAVAAFLEPEFRGLRVSARVTAGTGWELIPAIAAEEGCDLVVMSTHRHDSVEDAILGSRAERVVAVSPCPVLVI